MTRVLTVAHERARFVLEDMVRHELQTPEDELLITSEAAEQIQRFGAGLTHRALRTPGYSGAWCAKRWVVDLFAARWTFLRSRANDDIDRFTQAAFARAASDLAWRNALFTTIALASLMPNAGVVAVSRGVDAWLLANPP